MRKILTDQTMLTLSSTLPLTSSGEIWTRGPLRSFGFGRFAVTRRIDVVCVESDDEESEKVIGTLLEQRIVPRIVESTQTIHWRGQERRKRASYGHESRLLTDDRFSAPSGITISNARGQITSFSWQHSMGPQTPTDAPARHRRRSGNSTSSAFS
jgi:hypothetical protein